MTTDAIEYRTAPPPNLRHSPLAIAAFAISLLVPLMLLLGKLYNFLIDGHSETYWVKVRFFPALRAFTIASEALYPVGLIAGALAAMRRGYKRRLAVLACVINASVLAALLAWIMGLLPGR